jgi:hypothetical protein
MDSHIITCVWIGVKESVPSKLSLVVKNLIEFILTNVQATFQLQHQYFWISQPLGGRIGRNELTGGMVW